VKILKKLFDLLFPPKCVSCNSLLSNAESAFCIDCYREFEAAKRLPCRHCGREMMHCVCCGDNLVRSGIYRVFKVCPYFPERADSPELKLIFAVKRRNVTAYRRFVAREMAAAVKRSGDDLSGFTVTYVPRKPLSVTEYGFDHALELSKLLARELDLPWEAVFCRTSDAKEQKGLDRKERRKNATYTLLPINGVTATGKRYLICDDVLTTGASLAACGNILLALGAKEIRAAVFAQRN